MPMGPLKVFLAMRMKLKIELDTLAKELGLKNVASKIIVRVVCYCTGV